MLFNTFARVGAERFISGARNSTINSDESMWLSEHVYIDQNDVLRCSTNFDVVANIEELNDIMANYNNFLRQTYHEKMRYYKGDHTKIKQGNGFKEFEGNENKVVVNTARSIVNTFSGYFIGVPPKINYSPNRDEQDNQGQIDGINKAISQLLSDSDSDNTFYELAKKSDIYGRSYMIIYRDSNGALKFTQKSPENAFIVYGNDYDSTPMFSVTFEYVGGVWYAELSTPEKEVNISSQDYTAPTGLQARLKWNQAITENSLGRVTAVELPENDERLGMFDDLISILDAQDKAMSQKMDQNDYFNNAILLTKNVEEFTPEQKAQIKKWRVMQVNNTMDASKEVSVGYLSKPDADQLQEHSLEHLRETAYSVSQVVNLNDQNVSPTSSGFALTQRMQPMEMIASTKGAKMRKAIKEILEIALVASGTVPDSQVNEVVKGINVDFTPNIPHSFVDETNAFKNVFGKVSQEVALSYLSNVSNVDDEIKLENQEKQQDAQEFGSDQGSQASSGGDYQDQQGNTVPGKPKDDQQAGGSNVNDNG